MAEQLDNRTKTPVNSSLGFPPPLRRHRELLMKPQREYFSVE